MQKDKNKIKISCDSSTVDGGTWASGFFLLKAKDRGREVVACTIDDECTSDAHVLEIASSRVLIRLDECVVH